MILLTRVIMALLAEIADVCSDSDQLTDGQIRLGPGTLYRTLARLVADDLVSESETNDPNAPHDARRRYYRLTPLGERAVREEAELMARLVDAAHTAGVLDGNRRTS
jgi:DNA-binding PadR family transcriptional regulator